MGLELSQAYYRRHLGAARMNNHGETYVYGTA